MFLFSLVKAIFKNRLHHKNLITALNKEHASRELLRFRNFIYKKNMGIHKMKECKRNAINKYFFWRKFEKWKIYFRSLVLAALKCYFGDNIHKT